MGDDDGATTGAFVEGGIDAAATLLDPCDDIEWEGDGKDATG